MIRNAAPSDLSAIQKIATESGLFDAEQTDFLRTLFLEPGPEDVWFVIDHDGLLEGVAYLAPEKMTHGTWNLYWIAVLPKSQKRGLGAQLVQHVFSWLGERGERLLLVETAGIDEFEYVRRFYQSHGFTHAAVIPGFYDEGIDKVIFTKNLQ
jgi:ribosomal protein S18 acetylase RimI-like enzyme